MPGTLKSTPKRALLSVTNKQGLEKFKALTDAGWEIISTGGTATKLQELGIPCIPIEEVTNFPEMMDGRLKTLHPKVFGGILADRSKTKHLSDLMEQAIGLIDLVVVNLYAFQEKPGIENIDIGGPSLLRAAAKNGAHVTVVVDPDDYDWVISDMVDHGDTTLPSRETLAIKVFKHTFQYDLAILTWMESHRGPNKSEPFFSKTLSASH